MKYLRRLHGRQEPPGLERTILRRLPRVFVVGTLIPVGVSLLVRLLPPADPSADAAKHVTTVDIYATATVLTFWTAILTVAIGCIVVHIMKGPAYVADAYPLEDARRPRVANDEE